MYYVLCDFWFVCETSILFVSNINYLIFVSFQYKLNIWYKFSIFKVLCPILNFSNKVRLYLIFLKYFSITQFLSLSQRFKSFYLFQAILSVRCVSWPPPMWPYRTPVRELLWKVWQRTTQHEPHSWLDTCNLPTRSGWWLLSVVIRFS